VFQAGCLVVSEHHRGFVAVPCSAVMRFSGGGDSAP